MELFPFIDSLFDKKVYATVPDSVKRKHFFMAQRFISIKFPEQVDFYNHVNINQVAVMDFWHRWLNIKYKSKPKWMYTKSVKKKSKVTDKVAEKLAKIKITTVKYYMKFHECSQDDFDFRAEIFPDGLLDELKKIEKFMTDNGVKA